MGTCCGETADNKQVVIASDTNEDHNIKRCVFSLSLSLILHCEIGQKNCMTLFKIGHFSSKKMEGDEGLNTVACLRGRLLAERQASKVAKEEADSMGNKVI